MNLNELDIIYLYFFTSALSNLGTKMVMHLLLKYVKLLNNLVEEMFCKAKATGYM